MLDPAKAPQVSIIIPAYNRAHTIERAVESAFAAQNVSVEVIVVDDGSTDKTAKLVADMQASFGAALRLHVQRNAGASAARNAGLELARGSFVQFLDSDDFLAPHKLRAQIDAYDADPDLSVVLSYGWLEESDTEVRIGANLGQNPQSYIEALCGKRVHLIQTSSPLWRRAFLGDELRWNPQISLGDDLEFHIRCLATASIVGFVEEALFTVCSHEGDRLSDFSQSADRLKSQLKTRIAMHEALLERGKWTAGCAVNSAATLRSIYAVYLQRMERGEVREFEQGAQRICGQHWSGTELAALSLARRLAGKQGAAAAIKTGFAAKRIAGRVKRIPQGLKQRLGALLRANIGQELAHWRKSAPPAFMNPAPCTALYVELNTFHMEIVPGYVSLLAKAGFRTHVLHRCEVDIDDACSRLPKELRPLSHAMSLRAMRQFLRSEAVQRYELVMIGSGTLVEASRFWGGALDYLGAAPDGRAGHIIIEHAAKTIRERRDALTSTSLFALRDLKLGEQRLPMLAPVDFGQAYPALLADPVQFVAIGKLDQAKRDAAGLYAAVRTARAKHPRPFVIHLIGGTTLEEIPEDIREAFCAHGRITFHSMYEVIDKAHFLLMMLDSQTAHHREFLFHNTTGTRQLSLGFCKPVVVDSEFAAGYSWDETKAVVYRPGQLAQGLLGALDVSQGAYAEMQLGLAEMKAEIEARSVANLLHHLGQS